MTQNRKRGRSLLEDEVEFMPLSKRINNLHILEHSQPFSIGAYDMNSAEHFDGLDTRLPIFATSYPAENTIIPQYTPDLSPMENPHYFNINKLLFEMYVSRLQRGT